MSFDVGSKKHVPQDFCSLNLLTSLNWTQTTLFTKNVADVLVHLKSCSEAKVQKYTKKSGMTRSSFCNKQDRFTTCFKTCGTTPLEYQNCRKKKKKLVEMEKRKEHKWMANAYCKLVVSYGAFPCFIILFGRILHVMTLRERSQHSNI